MIRLRILIAAVCALAVGMVQGCKVDQAREVAAYRSILDQDAPTDVPFDRGDPLTLQTALALANQHNERLGIRGEEYLQALIAKDRAAAAFLPTVQLSPSHSAVDAGDSRTEDSPVERTDVPLNARANVFNGFSDLNSYRAASRNILLQRALLLDAQAVVLLDVSRIYYQILRAEESVRVLQNSLQAQEARLNEVQQQLRAGLGRPLDVSQRAAQVAGTRVSLIAAQNDTANGRAVLAFLTGTPVQASPLVDTLDLPPDLPDLDKLETLALLYRQDLAAAAAAIETARFAVKAAYGQYYPSISVNLNYYLSRESEPTESEWNALFNLNLPIFTGGVIKADVRRALSELRQANLTRRQVLQEVQVAHQNLLRSHQRLEQLDLQIKAASDAVRQAEGFEKAGFGTNLDAVIARDRLLAAELDRASETYDLKVFYLNLLRATGRLSLRLPGEPSPTSQPAGAPLALHQTP